MQLQLIASTTITATIGYLGDVALDLVDLVVAMAAQHQASCRASYQGPFRASFRATYQAWAACRATFQA